MPGYRYPFQRYESILTKSKLLEEYLFLLTTAFGQLFEDQHFVTLVKAEGVTEIPEQLAMRVRKARTPIAFQPQKLNSFGHRVRVAEQSYAKDVMTLSISCAYVQRLLNIASIEQYLTRLHSDILVSLERLLSEVRA